MNVTHPRLAQLRRAGTWFQLLSAALFSEFGCQNSDPTASDSAAVAGNGKGETSATPTASAGPTSTAAANLDTVIGTFAVQLAGGTTTVQGKVKNGDDAKNLVWDIDQTSGDCALLVPRIPFCETPCAGTDVCVEENACQAAPTSVDVGTVILTGVSRAGTTDPVTLKSIGWFRRRLRCHLLLCRYRIALAGA
jgi:hypothetical protein